MIPVPSRTRVVAAAAKASQTSGSRMASVGSIGRAPPEGSEHHVLAGPQRLVAELLGQAGQLEPGLGSRGRGC
jgi:hypothetical protein